jgi:hypothetical protein
MDFDKIKIPYDRTATLLEKDGSLIRKKNPLTSLTLTCIGQDCCDGSMVYDYARNKCIANGCNKKYKGGNLNALT